ncbi:hypothetical protein [Methylobacterium sp. Leaf108]|uniref:hypothetical protein n=1 Tax=Methylobacterium sp. Leaf108 TaxID=1736256 RepID=UPI0006F2DB01|nr:hypothetical protein [Methylobacterium sp. Leaf108]KQP61091.1 hypothetical protein ASF39_15580 [Methylobacterium sp. Leaf108]
MSAAKAKRSAPQAPALRVEFGRRDEDGRTWITFSGVPPEPVTLIWPGPLRQAGDIAQIINAGPSAVAAMLAAVADCRDPDTDCALSPATGGKLEEALAGFGVRS